MFSDFKSNIANLREFANFHEWLVEQDAFQGAGVVTLKLSLSGVEQVDFSPDYTTPYRNFIASMMDIAEYERVTFGDDNFVRIASPIEGVSIIFRAPEWAREIDDWAHRVSMSEKVTIKAVLDWVNTRVDNAEAY